MGRLLVLPALAASLALGACATQNNQPPPAPSPPNSPTSPAPQPPSGPSRAPVLSPLPAEGSDAQAAAIEAARQDAAQRLNLSPSAVQLEDVQRRQWPDRALGCPRQGVLYAQIVTPGYVVVVAGGGKHLEYHTDDRGQAVLCQER
jgi:hypothetical protein